MLRDIFQHLAKLRLGFYISEVVERNIAQTLSAATNLKSLYFHVMVDQVVDDKMTCKPGRPTAFHEIFGICRFRQLRSLTLDGFDSNEAEFVEFLRSSSHLQHLTLMHHKLRAKGTWESWANEIKVALPSLEQVVVKILESNVDDHNVEIHTHGFSCTDVHGFFFQGKVNPFICPQTQEKRVRVKFVVDDDNTNRPPSPTWSLSS